MQRSFRIPVVFSKRQTSALSSFTRVFRWRWVSIILLGLSSNTLVNAVLDLKYQRPLLSMSLEEYVNAIIAGWFLLSGTRLISKRLDKKLPWVEKPTKRLFVQMALHLTFIAVFFNLVLLGITYVFYGGFYVVGDVLIIDICTVAMTFLFSAFDSSISFFANWKQAQTIKEKVKTAEEQSIEILLGKSRYQIKLTSIRCVRAEQGVIYLYTDTKRYLYGESLDSLMELLDERQFFRANRQTILHRIVVSSFSSLPQGKVKVSYVVEEELSEKLTVSRTKAASFRQWMKAQ